MHISRIMASGTLITAASLLLLSTVHVLAPRALLNFSELLTGGTAYIARHVVIVGWTLLIQVALSVLLVIIVSDLRSLRTQRVIHQADAWHLIGEITVQPGCRVYMSVRLKSGAEIAGYYYGASTELDPSKRELLLRAPMLYRASDSQPGSSIAEDWQQMVICGSEIVHVAAANVVRPDFEEKSITRWTKVLTWGKENYLAWKVSLLALVVLLAFVVVVSRF